MGETTKLLPKSRSGIRRHWLPVLAGASLCILTIVVFWTIEKREEINRHGAVTAESRRVLDLLKLDMTNRIQSLRRIVNRWEIRGGMPKEEFESDARSYIADAPGYQAIEWVDKSFHVKWIVPLSGNEAAMDLDLAFEENRRSALEYARDGRVPTMTSPIDLVQGGKGVLEYLPIYIDREFEGFVLAVFRTQDWLEYVLRVEREKDDAGGFLTLVSMDGTIVFESETWEEIRKSRWDASTEAVIFDHSFLVRVRPTDEFIKQSHTRLPEFILAVGILISFLVSTIVFLYQKESMAAKRAQVGITRLEKEVLVRETVEKSLADERRRISYILEGTNVGTWEWNVQTGEANFNARWAEIVGYALEEINTNTIDTWTKLAHPDDLIISGELLERNYSGELDYYECEVRMCHKNGSWIWVLDRGKISTWTDDGKPLLMSGTHQDITERKRMESALRQSEEKYRSILNSMEDLVFVLDKDGIFVDFHQPGKDSETYVSPAIFIGKSYIDVLPEDAVAKLKVGIEEVGRTNLPQEVEYSLKESALERWFQAKISVRRDDTGKFAGVTAVARDITDRKISEEKIRHMASHDALTGLPSLNLALDRLSVAIEGAARSKAPTAVLFVDLDGFKQVNDTFGHDAGDAVLKEMAARFLTCVRKSDTVARIGGDEFLIIATEMQSVHNAELIARKLLAEVDRIIVYKGQELKVGTSIGISSYPIDGDNAESLIKKADSAMYKTKRSGKNSFAFAGSD